MTDFAYDGPIFLVPLSPSYPSSPVYILLDRIKSNQNHMAIQLKGLLALFFRGKKSCFPVSILFVIFNYYHFLYPIKAKP